MSNATMSPTDLAAITGTERHYFRIAASDFVECECCKGQLQAAYESFSTPSGDDMDRTGTIGICIPCVMKGGRQCVLESVRNLVEEYLADETEVEMIALWNAVRDQFEMGLFEIQTPATEYDLVLAITEATIKHTNTANMAMASVVRGMRTDMADLHIEQAV